MKKRKFCMFILSHGRPEKILTLNMLKRTGYTGDWFIVIDDADKTAAQYRELYGEKVIEFNKREIGKTFDIGDNFQKTNVVVYARNACFQLAEDLGYTHFMQLDDDYTAFSLRFNAEGQFKNKPIRDFDFIIEAMLNFYEKSGATCLAFAQGGDFIGGDQSFFGQNIFLKRKAMNTMLCSVHRPFQYLGLVNEDVNAYVRHGQLGKLFFTINTLSVNQLQTQSNSGGLTDIYLEQGTFVKSFYSILYSPSSVKISKMGNKDMRLHHKIRWNNTVPQIISERFKKKPERLETSE